MDEIQNEQIESTQENVESAPEAAVEQTQEAAPAEQTIVDKIKAKQSVLNTVEEEKAPELPKYIPNYKFKSLDKEFEFDKELQPLIKEEAVEKKIRELYEKAYGLDFIKPRYNETREKFKEVESFNKKLMSDVTELRDHFQRNDFDSFFARLNIPQEKIFQWVLEKARYQEMSPEQRSMIDSRRQAEQRAYELERQVQAKEQMYESQVVQAKAEALDAALIQPEVAKFMQTYDAIKGPGAFRNKVCDYGEFAWHTKKQDLTPSQAIKLVMEDFGALVNVNTQAEEQPVVEVPKAPVQEVKPKKPVIPSVSGRTTTPVKPKYRSLDDLKNRRLELMKANN